MPLTRRVFLLSCAALTAAGCVENKKPVSDNLLRPPGALAEEEFLSRCNRCQRCVQVCPTRAIFPASIEFGAVRLNTPVVVFKNSYCNSCLKCSLVCPTKALVPVTEAALDIGVGVIEEKNCVAWYWMGCTVCVDKCPLKAIYLDDAKRPVVIPEKCNGCGICQKECPSTSLRSGVKGKGVVVKRRGADAPPREVIEQRAVSVSL